MFSWLVLKMFRNSCTKSSLESHGYLSLAPEGSKQSNGKRELFTSIGKMQPNTTFNIYIAKRLFYIACLNNYMFQPPYRPSSGCKFSYFKANYTIYNVFVFVNKRSCTFIKLVFKICISIIIVAVELKIIVI